MPKNNADTNLKFSKITRYQVNTQKSFVLMYARIK